ncbi:MAG: hypothetical protein WCF57_06990 [Pyrinomonadaceae bacterium]
MKRPAIFFSLILVCLLATGTAFGQQGCDFNIIGTWKVAAPDEKSSVLYRFAPDGTVTALSSSLSGKGSEPQEIARATYKVKNPIVPKAIAFTATSGSEVFAEGTSLMQITSYDDASFTCVKPGSAPSRWVKVDPNRYFIVLAARSGAFYDRSGPAFPMLVRIAGRETQVDAVGTYSVKGKRTFGVVPPEAYQEFMKEPRTDSEVMLRLAINAAQYERGLKIMGNWGRRVREDALLYPRTSYLNNILLVKEIVESLNRCGEKIKMYNLSYLSHEDWIAEKYGSPFIPFNYFKELRRLNESLHVRDAEFSKLW